MSDAKILVVDRTGDAAEHEYEREKRGADDQTPDRRQWAETGEPTVLRFVDMQKIDRSRRGGHHHVGQLAVQRGESAAGNGLRSS